MIFSSPYYVKVLFFVCGGAALAGFLGMATLVPFVIGRRFQKGKRIEEEDVKETHTKKTLLKKYLAILRGT